MEEQEGNSKVYQMGTLFVVPREARTGVPTPPVLSPSTVNTCRSFCSGLHDMEMLDDDDEEEDVDYEIGDDEEEEDEEEEDDDEEEDVEDEADEEAVTEGLQVVAIDMGSFAEPGRKFLSKVWKEYEPIRVDGVVVAAECKHCARKICAERKHGTSSLRKHLKRCNERKKALRVAGQLSASIMTPDGVALGPWTFNQAVSRKELMRMIVLHELPFSLVEYAGFRRFVSSLNPSFKIICRHTTRSDCLKAFKEEKLVLQSLLSKSKSKISMTMDLWTSNRMVGYICITVHYIDEEWKSQKRIVKFTAMETLHTGMAMFNTVEKFIREWKIEDKIFSVTLDNASNNGAMMKLLKTHLLNKNMLVFSGKMFHQRCAAHVINLICQAGLEYLDPVIIKIRESVKYIRSSAARKEKFEEIVAQLDITCEKEPCLDVSTRWNSTYLMLATAKEFRLVFDSMAIQDANYTFKPSFDEWENAIIVCELLKVFYEATNVISATKYPTANLYLHELLKVKLTLDKWEQQPFEEESEVHTMVKYMKKKFDKYWKISWLDLCVPVILDPQFKLKYLEFRFAKEFGYDAIGIINKVKKLMDSMFKEYLKLNDNSSNTISQGDDVEMVVNDQDPLASWDQQVTLSSRSTNEASFELESYLKKVPIRRSDQFNILAWWQMSSAEYPTLSLMARDILAVPASTIASESAFSTGSRVLSDFRSRMTPEIVEALVCLQYWIRATSNTRRRMESIHDIILAEGEEEAHEEYVIISTSNLCSNIVLSVSVNSDQCISRWFGGWCLVNVISGVIGSVISGCTKQTTEKPEMLYVLPMTCNR